MQLQTPAIHVANGRTFVLLSHLLSVVCVQYVHVHQPEFPSTQCSESYLFAGMQPSRNDPGCRWESKYQPWLSIVVYSCQQIRQLQMWWANPPPREDRVLWSKYKPNSGANILLYGLQWRRGCGLCFWLSFCQQESRGSGNVCKISTECFWTEPISVQWVEPHWSDVQPMPKGFGNRYLFV